MVKIQHTSTYIQSNYTRVGCFGSSSFCSQTKRGQESFNKIEISDVHGYINHINNN